MVPIGPCSFVVLLLHIVFYPPTVSHFRFWLFAFSFSVLHIILFCILYGTWESKNTYSGTSQGYRVGKSNILIFIFQTGGHIFFTAPRKKPGAGQGRTKRGPRRERCFPCQMQQHLTQFNSHRKCNSFFLLSFALSPSPV